MKIDWSKVSSITDLVSPSLRNFAKRAIYILTGTTEEMRNDNRTM